MKRRAISFMTALVLCLGLCPAQVLAAGWEPDDLDFADMPDVGTTVNQDTTIKKTFEISWEETFDTCGHSYSSPDMTVLRILRILSSGRVYLTYGTIESGSEAGIEIQDGGFLYVKDPGMNVTGATCSLDIQFGAQVQICGGTFTGGMCSLDIASGAEVRISGGTFIATNEGGMAIRVADGDYASLLADGCAFFDRDDEMLRPEEVSGAGTVLQVKKCAGHEYDDVYKAKPGEPTHNGTCVYCGETSTLECEFSFVGTSDSANCADCAHELTIYIDGGKLDYTGNDTNFDAVEVWLEDGAKLTEGTDYTVEYSSRVDGEITVTVTSTSQSHAWTYTKSFSDTWAVLTIEWEDEEDRDTDYTGSTVVRSVLPEVIISGAVNDTDKAELEQLIYFSYEKDGVADFTDGLPTDAGEYQIKANLPATQNYRGAFSDPITLTIKKISPIIEFPAAVPDLTYDRNVHELVTPGSVRPGAVIQFARTQDGPWSGSIPTETNAGEYEVWYKVDETNNYKEVLKGLIAAQIQKRRIEPGVKLEQTSFVYDNGTKEPSVTVTDPSDGNWVLHETEYNVKYKNNQNVSTEGNPAQAIVSSTQKNYDFAEVTREFTITPANQAGLTITGQPSKVYYGDTIQLSTTGGSGNGAVTWSVVAEKTEKDENGNPIAEEGESEGQFVIKGVGDITVMATRAAGDNYVTAEDSWTFHAYPKPVTVVVKPVETEMYYDKDRSLTIDLSASVPGTDIVIKDIKGTLTDVNAGDKIVEIDLGSIKDENVESPNGGDDPKNDPKNYDISYPETITVTIKPAEQAPFSIDGPGDPIYYGEQFMMRSFGGSGNGVITWSGTGVDVDNTGLVKVTAMGNGLTVTATKEASTNYKAATYTWSFDALPKPVTATVTADDKTYDNSNAATVHVTWEDGALINGDIIDTSDVTGTFASADVGEKIIVNVTGSAKKDATSEKYDIEIPSTTTATISRARADVKDPPRANTAPIYVESDKELVIAGTTVGGIGTIVYALENPYEEQEKQDDMLDEDLDDYEDLDPDPPGLVYTEEIPTAEKITKADTYKVWYKIMPATNWIGTEPKYVEVTITKAGENTGEFEEEDDFEDLDSVNPGSTTSRAPGTSQTSGSSSTSSSGADASSGTNTTQSASKPGTGSVSMQTSVQDRTASTVLDSAAGSQLVNEAVANKSANVVIKPEITGDVSKTEVSIPASAVSRIGSETDAALTVSTPVADVTIPNTSLDTLSGAGGAVSVVTERVENTVVLTLNADGKDIGDIPGGLTLTVPSENTTPGTVAVLVHEDGTREIIRKSVAEDGGVRIPLNGSATVEIVDNSKEFADVPAESWAADAVAFASAHEILNGTGEATFSPEISMSRAMLATVLYNLEGCPDQGLTSAFSDVDSDAWYAAGISWAAANGITSGYGDGQYGPNDNITREQLAVMLWRYMESPAADKQVPDFTDTDQASSYAMEALYWAAANGIVNGYGNGQLDPSGLATRAQAAQMLKNFIENT